MATQPDEEHLLPAVLDAVDSSRAKLVFLYLDERGPASPKQIADELDLPLLVILPVLGNEGLVGQDSADRLRLTTSA